MPFYSQSDVRKYELKSLQVRPNMGANDPPSPPVLTCYTPKIAIFINITAVSVVLSVIVFHSVSH